LIWSYQKLNIFSFVTPNSFQNRIPRFASATIVSTIFLITTMFMAISTKQIIHESQGKTTLLSGVESTFFGLRCIYEVVVSHPKPRGGDLRFIASQVSNARPGPPLVYSFWFLRKAAKCKCRSFDSAEERFAQDDRLFLVQARDLGHPSRILTIGMGW
jgi:hypothetical protein